MYYVTYIDFHRVHAHVGHVHDQRVFLVARLQEEERRLHVHVATQTREQRQLRVDKLRLAVINILPVFHVAHLRHGSESCHSTEATALQMRISGNHALTFENGDVIQDQGRLLFLRIVVVRLPVYFYFILQYY